MKRFVILLSVFFLPIMFLFISCKTEHFRITAISIIAVEKVNEGGYQEVDDVIQSITIQIQPIEERVSDSRLPIGFAQPLYAAFHPSEPVMDNEIIYERTELLLDKDIYYKGELIEKSTNLMLHPAIKEFARIVYMSNPGLRLYGFGVEFDDEFYEDINIPDGEYTITVICHTDDDLELKSHLIKTIKLSKE